MNTTAVTIDIYMDHVLIEGVRINRPSRISRSEWMKFWERFK